MEQDVGESLYLNAYATFSFIVGRDCLIEGRPGDRGHILS